jgi:hypothetical protein
MAAILDSIELKVEGLHLRWSGHCDPHINLVAAYRRA